MSLHEKVGAQSTECGAKRLFCTVLGVARLLAGPSILDSRVLAGLGSTGRTLSWRLWGRRAANATGPCSPEKERAQVYQLVLSEARFRPKWTNCCMHSVVGYQS